MPSLKQLLEVIASDPEDPIIHFSLAIAYRHAQQSAKAVEHFQLAVRYKPDYSAAWFELARTAERMDDVATACEAYRGAMEASAHTGDDHVLKAARVRLTRLERQQP